MRIYVASFWIETDEELIVSSTDSDTDTNDVDLPASYAAED